LIPLEKGTPNFPTDKVKVEVSIAQELGNKHNEQPYINRFQETRAGGGKSLPQWGKRKKGMKTIKEVSKEKRADAGWGTESGGNHLAIGEGNDGQRGSAQEDEQEHGAL